jgi:hypothetical protein
VEDRAGNVLVLATRVGRDGQALHAQVDSVQYDDAAPALLPRNALEMQWALGEDGDLVSLQQRYTLGPRGPRQTLSAEFDAARDLTRLQKGRRDSDTRPGLYVVTVVVTGHRLRFDADAQEAAAA